MAASRALRDRVKGGEADLTGTRVGGGKGEILFLFAVFAENRNIWARDKELHISAVSTIEYGRETPR